MKDYYYLAVPALLLMIILIMGIVGSVRKRKIRRLTEAINAFLLKGTLLPVSTADSPMGHLQTNIYELQNRVVQEHEATRREAHRNTQFISDISHQLKTPLAGLRLYCEMDLISPHAKQELALIEKMERLIENVLTLEKLRSDTYEMDFADCELGDVVRSVVADLKPLFPRKHITVIGGGKLRADSTWLHEAIANVVKNACEHTAPNGTVSISMAPGEKTVTVTIKDNGGGVSPEELPLLFDRFHRAEDAPPTSAGVGLAITKAIIDKHHGTVGAENTDWGLSVHMCLPVIDANLKI